MRATASTTTRARGASHRPRRRRALERAATTRTLRALREPDVNDAVDEIASDDANDDANERLDAFLRRKGRHASFSATKIASRRVHQAPEARAVRAYMSLPASQYSTLDGESVERVSDDTFKVELSELAFLGLSLRPRLKAKVRVRDDGSGCEVRVGDMELTGSGVVEYASDAFEIVSVNNVTWCDVESEALSAEERAVVESRGGEYKELTSETSVRVYIIVPGWFPFTIKSTERTGRFVVNQVVAQVVPRFLNQLAEDYGTWSRGDDSRTASAKGMFDCDVDDSAQECEAV